MARLNSSGAFPRYDDGDVVLSLSEEPEDMLVLHSTILCLHSEFFRTSLNDTWIKNKLAGTKTFEGREVRMVRYEWEFGEETFYSNCMESDSGMLIGKVSEPPVRDL